MRFDADGLLVHFLGQDPIHAAESYSTFLGDLQLREYLFLNFQPLVVLFV